jgi:hypothetical protein
MMAYTTTPLPMLLSGTEEYNKQPPMRLTRSMHELTNNTNNISDVRTGDGKLNQLTNQPLIMLSVLKTFPLSTSNLTEESIGVSTGRAPRVLVSVSKSNTYFH